MTRMSQAIKRTDARRKAGRVKGSGVPRKVRKTRN